MLTQKKSIYFFFCFHPRPQRPRFFRSLFLALTIVSNYELTERIGASGDENVLLPQVFLGLFYVHWLSSEGSATNSRLRDFEVHNSKARCRKLVKQKNLERSVKKNVGLNYNSWATLLAKKASFRKGRFIARLSLNHFLDKSDSIPVMFPVGKLEVTHLGFRQVASLFSMN